MVSLVSDYVSESGKEPSTASDGLVVGGLNRYLHMFL